MKKRILYLATLLVVILAFSSCDNDDNYNDSYIISYGVITSVDQNDNYAAIIKQDGGAILTVTESLVNVKLEADMRVIMNYTILGLTRTSSSDNKNYFDVRLNAIDSVLSKGVVKQSFINEDKELISDSLGNDPIVKIHNAWFTEKFLNLNFEYYTNNLSRTTDSRKRHMISLIYDDVTLEDGAVVLTLRHNAFEDVPTGNVQYYNALARVSFDVSSIIPEGQTSTKIILKWKSYGTSVNNVVENSYKSEFDPSIYSDNSDLKPVPNNRNNLIGGPVYNFNDAFIIVK